MLWRRAGHGGVTLGRNVAERHGLALPGWGLPGLPAGAGIAGGTTAGASLGCPGQEGVQVGSGRGSSGIAGAFLQVAGQQAEGLDAPAAVAVTVHTSAARRAAHWASEP